MDALEMDLLAREVDALQADLDEARFRHVAGLEPEPALARLFAARPRVAHKDTAAALREAGAADLADRVAALRADRVAAEHEESWRAADARAAGIGLRGPEPLASLEVAATRERDPARRVLLARAAADAMSAAASAREAWAETRARARAEVGLAPDWPAVVDGDQALAASDDGYRDVLAFTVRRELAVRPDGLARADLLHALALSRWDGLFRPGMLPLALKLAFEKLGLDRGRIAIDDVERPSRWPGAHAFGTRVSFRPRGGGGDWQDLLAAAARAVAARAPDAVVPEALSWLVGSLVLEPRWLAERADVEKRNAGDVVRDLALRRLFALRADAAALRIAVEVERGLAGAPWREAYRDALTAATGATWDRVRASRDADAIQLAGRIRGAAEGERLRADVRERFDEDWWRNPRTGAHLAALLAAKPEAEPPAPAVEAARMLVGKLEGS